MSSFPSLSETLFDNFPYAQFLLAQDEQRQWRLVLCNKTAAALFGIHRTPSTGLAVTQLSDQEIAATLISAANACLDSRSTNTNAGMIFPDENCYSLTVMPIFDAAQIVTHVQITALPKDAKLQRERDAALQANQAKSAFLAGMSHELRTPLNAIVGFSELIRSEVFGKIGHAKYAEYLNDIQFAAGHLLEIINDVLDISKIEAGKFELLEQKIDIGALLESVTRVMSDKAGTARIFLRVEIARDIEALYADKRVLRQMLFNLISNAIKFSPAGGTVTIKAARHAKDGKAFLSVQDQGKGIDANDIARMLEPFAQDHASISGGIGTGLGLPLTRAMAELHGGSLRIDSHPGNGTVATITLPASRIIRENTFAEKQLRFG